MILSESSWIIIANHLVEAFQLSHPEIPLKKAQQQCQEHADDRAVARQKWCHDVRQRILCRKTIFVASLSAICCRICRRLSSGTK